MIPNRLGFSFLHSRVADLHVLGDTKPRRPAVHAGYHGKLVVARAATVRVNSKLPACPLHHRTPLALVPRAEGTTRIEHAE